MWGAIVRFRAQLLVGSTTRKSRLAIMPAILSASWTWRMMAIWHVGHPYGPSLFRLREQSKLTDCVNASLTTILSYLNNVLTFMYPICPIDITAAPANRSPTGNTHHRIPDQAQTVSPNSPLSPDVSSRDEGGSNSCPLAAYSPPSAEVF